MEIKGVIFDLDGVLVSTDMLHFAAWKALAEELGIMNFTLEDNVRQRGVSRMASLEVVLEKGDKTYSQEEKMELAEKKNDMYVQSLDGLTPADVLAGVESLIMDLKEKGIKLSVGSASKNAPIILEKTGLLSKMDAVSCGLDVTKSKPDPEVFLVAAEKLGLAPEHCLVVEDSHAGVEAAKRGGMWALAVGEAKDSPLADFRAEDLSVGNLDKLLK